MLKLLLFPFAVLYDAVTSFRNTLYDLGYKPAARFEIPIISIGNLAVGGTGKTPMVEYLIRLLYPQFKLATLSRGYGRKTSGIRIAAMNDNAATVGDEPFQLFKKFGDKIGVAVGEERALAIPHIVDQIPEVQVILLDDAFQHRKVNPAFQILLTDYQRPFYNDYLMPAGRLRESRGGVSRADTVVITKCPADISDDEMIEIEKNVRDYTEKPVFFTSVRYGNPIGLLPSAVFNDRVILLSGIANSKPFEAYCRSKWKVFGHLEFADHHNYSAKDLQDINAAAIKNKCTVLTTEKDAVKLENPKLQSLLKDVSVFYLPIETAFVKNGKDFDEMILNSVSGV